MPTTGGISKSTYGPNGPANQPTPVADSSGVEDLESLGQPPVREARLGGHAAHPGAQAFGQVVQVRRLALMSAQGRDLAREVSVTSR